MRTLWANAGRGELTHFPPRGWPQTGRFASGHLEGRPRAPWGRSAPWAGFFTKACDSWEFSPYKRLH